jgi:hypothetical protein
MPIGYHPFFSARDVAYLTLPIRLIRLIRLIRDTEASRRIANRTQQVIIDERQSQNR